MLSLIRSLTKSWIGPVIMGIITVAFIVLGPGGAARDVLRGHIEDSVVDAGSHSVSSQQFQTDFNRIKQNFEEQSQQPYPLEEALKEGVDKELVNQLSSEQSYYEMLSRSGVRPSDAVLAVELRNAAQSGASPELAQVFDSVTGRFKPELLRRLLQSNGMTLDDFQKERRDAIANEQFGSAVSDGFHTPLIYEAIQIAFSTESRDVTYFVIPLASVPPPPPPTDAQLNALITQYHDQLMLPERRTLTIVRFSAKELAPTMPVDPALVQQQFEAKKASYGKPELRSLVEIPLNNPADAAKVQAGLTAGEDPNAVAKSVGVAAVSYADQPQAAIADAKAAVAAFAMQAGQVSGPIQGDSKTVIVKVLKITPGVAPSLDAARPQIEADLRQQEALDKVYDLSHKFEDAQQSGDSLALAAGKVGAPTLSVGPVGADGKDVTTGQVNPILTQKLLKTAFTLAANGDSDVEEDADKGEYYAVHVDQILPPRVRSLDDPGMRQQVTGAYMNQAVVAVLRKRAADATAAMAKGETIDAAASAAGGHIVHQLGLQRINAQQYEQTLGKDLLEQIFAAKTGVAFAEGSDPLKGLVVGRVDAVRPADPKQIAAMIAAQRQHDDQAYLQAIAATTREAAVKMVKPTTNLALADSAMGADEAMLARIRPKTPAKAASPAQ